jgi:Holliday junction resolvase RusA-like endonuclease
MISFLCDSRPVSINARYQQIYQQKIAGAYRKYYSGMPDMIDYNLYGIVYYFHKCKTELDADNLSKPIWDALQKVIYDDDRIIKLRHSGIYDISKPASITEFNTTGMTPQVLKDFLELMDDSTKEHIVYIELGRLSNALYVLGVEESAQIS